MKQLATLVQMSHSSVFNPEIWENALDHEGKSSNLSTKYEVS